MYAARSAKPTLSLSIPTAQNAPRTSLSLKSPPAFSHRTPMSPPAASPAGTRFSSIQAPNYAYTNSCSSKSILKKHPMDGSSNSEKRIQFKGTPVVHCVTPIENKDEYYEKYTKLSRDERRWMLRE